MARQPRNASSRFEIRLFEAKRPGAFNHVFSDMVKGLMKAALPQPSPMFYVEYLNWVTAAAAARLPTIYWFREAIGAGGLMCYGSNFPAIFRRSGEYVAKISNGAKPTSPSSSP